MHSSAADPLGGKDLGTADKTFSLDLDHHGRNAGGLMGYTGFPTCRFLMEFIRLAIISNFSVSYSLWDPRQYWCKVIYASPIQFVQLLRYPSV